MFAAYFFQRVNLKTYFVNVFCLLQRWSGKLVFLGWFAKRQINEVHVQEAEPCRVTSDAVVLPVATLPAFNPTITNAVFSKPYNPPFFTNAFNTCW
jgi:hypothetical protein